MGYLMLPDEDRVHYPPQPKTVLIVGIAGQDGSYLAEHLLALGHRVHGTVRREPAEIHERLRHIREDITLHHLDLLDGRPLTQMLEEVQPERVFNLAGVPSAAWSYRRPVYCAELDGLGVTRLLEAIRQANPRIRLFQASSSAIFGSGPPGGSPRDEEAPIHPQSPYGIAKAYAHFITAHYRERYDLYAVNGILFPHTSPRQSLHHFTRRITFAAARARLGETSELVLGDLAGRLDLGFAGDYAEAMWGALQPSSPSDYVIGTGAAHSVAELVGMAFDYVGIDWREHVSVDPSGPVEQAEGLLADSGRASCAFGWRPKVGCEQLIQAMIVSEFYRLETVRRDPWRYVASTTAAAIRGPRPNWPLGKKRRFG